MELPVYIEGEAVGTVHLAPQGGGWRAQVRMRDIGRVARLSVFGRGESVYLGIPEPDGCGAMTLSRNLRQMPEGAQYAAEREGGPKPQKQGREPEEKTPAPRHVVWMGGRPYFF